MKYSIEKIITMIMAVVTWMRKNFTVSVKTDCGVNYNCVPLTQEVVDFVNFLDWNDFHFELSVNAKDKHVVLVTSGEVKTSLWQIKSKTGTFIGCNGEEDAHAEALRRSTKTAMWSVYKDYQYVASYINNKKLTPWQNVYSYTDIEPYTFIDKTDEKVRVRTSNIIYVGERGRIKAFSTMSITFHKDGKVYIREGKHIRLFAHAYETRDLCYLEYGAKIALINELAKLRPEINKNLYFLNSNSFANERSTREIVEIFSYPSMFYRFDAYKGTAEERRTFDFIYKGVSHEVLDDNEFIKRTAIKLGVPTGKKFLKFYRENYCMIRLAVFAKESGINNPDLIRRILELHEKLRKERDDIDLFNAFMFKSRRSTLKTIVNIKHEAVLVKMLEQERTDVLEDIYRLVNSGYVDEDILNEVIKECPNFQSIHDTLTRYVNVNRRKHRMVDAIIPYSDEELKLNGVYDNVEFQLATSKKDLAIVGYKMGICVGGYANDACAKRLSIVKMIDNEKYVGCLELHGKEIVQIKAKYNNPLEMKYKHALDQWMDSNGLWSCCSDYDNIGDSWFCHTDYNHMHPDMFANEDHDDNRLVMVKSEPVGWTEPSRHVDVGFPF